MKALLITGGCLHCLIKILWPPAKYHVGAPGTDKTTFIWLGMDSIISLKASSGIWCQNVNSRSFNYRRLWEEFLQSKHIGPTHHINAQQGSCSCGFPQVYAVMLTRKKEKWCDFDENQNVMVKRLGQNNDTVSVSMYYLYHKRVGV